MKDSSLVLALATILAATPLVSAAGRGGLGRLRPSEGKSFSTPEGNTSATNEVRPEIVVPGDWVTDRDSEYMFLPLTVPRGIDIRQCKVLCNGDSLLVVVTEQPEDVPEDDALRKYRLVVGALKSEAGHDERLLKSKLQAWLETEEDDEVRVRVQSALDSLSHIRIVKHNTTPRTVKVPLGLPSLLQQGRGAMRYMRRRALAGIVRESFSVEIPYPVPVEKVFAVQSKPTMLLVGMPLLRSTLEAQGISTGATPFTRVPVFGAKGQHLAGPREKGLGGFAVGLDVRSLDVALVPLKL